MDKKENENSENNDQFYDNSGCGLECEDNMHDEREDLESHSANEESIMHLVLDDDTELDCMVLGFFQVDENEYIALFPVDEEKAESGVLLYEYVELEEDEFDLLSIEDDKEFEEVSQVFYKLFSEEELLQFETDFHEHEYELGNYDEDELQE